MDEASQIENLVSQSFQLYFKCSHMANGYSTVQCRFTEDFHYLTEFYWTVQTKIRLTGTGIFKKRKGKLMIASKKQENKERRKLVMISRCHDQLMS